MNRSLNSLEKMILAYLSREAKLDIGPLNRISVFVVDEEYRSIRSAKLKHHESLRSVAECQFTDDDGVPVAVIMLLDKDDNFGELVFWKGDGTLIKSMPESDSSLHSFELR